MALLNYKIQADTYAPGLKPKSNPEDMEKIKDLYSKLENRLSGIDEELDNCMVEKLVISVIKKGGVADEDESDES